jgi:hypothetical protein
MKELTISPLRISDLIFAVNPNINAATFHDNIRAPDQFELGNKDTSPQAGFSKHAPNGTDDYGNFQTQRKSTKSAMQSKCEDTFLQLTTRCAGFVEVSMRK